MGHGDDECTPEQLFAGFPDGRLIYDAVEQAVHGFGTASIRASRSQIAFRRRKGFAFVWRPGQYVASTVPAVLSIALPHAVESPRFTSVVHPAPMVWMHHLELHDPGEVDEQVSGWLAQAYDGAG